MSTMSSYRRWTRDQEDIDRLPHGMVRTAYDADTRQYTFFDTTEGANYVSAPGEAYGTLVPAATAPHPRASRTSGRRSSRQAYDRPVFFADDMGIQHRSSTPPTSGHKRNPTMPASSWHHSRSNTSSGSTRKHGRNRSTSFSEFVSPHLIGRASDSSPPATSKPSYQRARGSFIRSAPPSPPPPSYGFGEEKVTKTKVKEGWSSPTDPLSSLPTLIATPPPLPPKDYPASSAQQQSGETYGPRVAMSLTARVLGRTLEAVKRVQRSRSPNGRASQAVSEGWVTV